MFNTTSAPLINLISTSIAAGDSYLWNGPICPTCNRGYDGSRGHACSAADLRAAIRALQVKLDELEPKCQHCWEPIPHGFACLPGQAVNKQQRAPGPWVHHFDIDVQKVYAVNRKGQRRLIEIVERPCCCDTPRGADHVPLLQRLPRLL